MSETYATSDRPKLDNCFLWLDYFSLRHARSDFEPYAMVNLIREIGFMVATIDAKLEYFKRSFCLLEFYAASTSDVTLITDIKLNREELGDLLKTSSIRSAEAETRDVDDKALIDGFILSGIPGGFAELDRIATSRLLSDARHAGYSGLPSQPSHCSIQ